MSTSATVRRGWFVCVLLSLLPGTPGFAQHDSLAHVYDLVVRRGHVMNPENNFSGDVDIGIDGGTIEVVADRRLEGKKTIDAEGLIVAPGFIDILSYNPNELGAWNKVEDGVTTNLAMHGGTSDPDRWYAEYGRQKPPVNYGASFFYTEARNRFNLSRYKSASADQIEKLLGIAERALSAGALGVSFSPEYIPGISAAEIVPQMLLAKKYGAPVFFHVRYSTMVPPGTNIDALNEVIEYALQTGAAVHIDHINSTGGTFSMKQSLKLLAEARKAGVDVTASIYPYNFWGTYLNSARFDPGWQERFHIGYGDLQIAGTAERLTKDSFERYRKEGKIAVAYAIPEQDVIDAIESPFVMIGSDAILGPSHNNHPRASGTFARTIALYAREKKVITLMEALAKMTIQPARLLEPIAPMMKKKGRISEGADADIVIFDYNRMQDRATVEHPEYASTGISYVIVGGRIVKDLDGLHKQVRMGKPIRGLVKRAVQMSN